MMDYIKKNKGKISQILVYMTDRFSRTGGAAIKLAEDLRQKYGVTIYAICQPTDTRDESGIFNQNLQLLFSHYENRLRRHRAITGMKAKFEKGEWVVKPPQGYDIVKVNGERKIVVNEIGKKLRKAFMWKSEGMKNEEIIERLRTMGVPMYKQQLTKIFKKPFYCGIVAHGLLEGKVVEGKHENLISPEIFLKVNNIHQQSPNYGVPHQKENEKLPLKVFVKCNDCDQPFTGYLVKKKGLYYYKCRKDGCRCNKNAEQLHKTFIETLLKFFVREELATSVQYDLEQIFHDMNKTNVEQHTLLKHQLGEVNKKIDTAEEKYFILNEMTKEAFEKFHSKYKEEQLKILEQLDLCRTTISNLPMYVGKTVSLSAKLRTVWASGDISFKEDLQKLIFPKGIHYDRQKDEFRTEKVNSIFAIIAGKSGSVIENKEGTNQCFVDLSPSADRTGPQILI